MRGGWQRQLEWLIRTDTRYSGITASAKNGNYKGRERIKLD